MAKTNKKAEAMKPGAKFEFWTVQGVDETKADYVICKCCCGEVKPVNVYSLSSGKSRSCGCKTVFFMQQTIEERNGRR